MEKIKLQLAVLLSSITKYDKDKIYLLIEKPKKRKWGQLSFPVFSFSKNPGEYAKKLCSQINESKEAYFVEKTECVGGFINFHFQHSYLLEMLSENFPKGEIQNRIHSNPQTIVVDYSSPNVAKFMNIGHFRATIIGQAIVNIARYYGHKVIALNHLGDWGTQFGKLIVAYQKWGEGQPPSLSLLVDLYVRFHKSAEHDDSLNEQAREVFRKMEQGHSPYLKLWSEFVSVSLKEYQKIWKRLNIHHDLTHGESFYKDKTSIVEKTLKEQKILVKSQGALVVFLGEKMPPCLIKKKDGASTYSCRDLASVIYRFKTLKADQNIYVTGIDHQLHFRQIKQVLEKINPKWNKQTLHLPFGMYQFKGAGKLSSRKGQSVDLLDLMNQSAGKVLDLINEKNPNLEDKEKIAESVGIGALIFNDLANDRIKDVEFSWDKILNFEGDSGPFVQYCYVRCLSLLKKSSAKAVIEDLKNVSNIEEELEWLEKLLEFESQLAKAFKQFKPHILSIYLLELCHLFNRFYSRNRILNSSKQNFRLALVTVTKNILKQGLELLNISAPQAM